ncbi:MAG: threonylcarbamoyl-AMP synthase [Lachnospiraceae bacterium]|nr:threonylcarbamoyl-AMP synthase [Lachnospiraceae bacterium]
MKTKILRLDPQHFLPEDLAEAGEILRVGGLVAFPTETVYGLGANALDAEAATKIYAAKGRPSDNPLIVHIASEEELAPLVKCVPQMAVPLMKTFWPGPMTLIFPKSDLVPSRTTGGLDTVAVRMPSDPIAAEMIRQARVPIAAPSANVSGRPSPTKAEHVVEDMNGRIDMIIDGGQVGIGLESTIIDCTGAEPVILRPGFISQEMLKDVCGHVGIDRASVEKPKEGERPKAPGMKYRHYAPKAEMTAFHGKPEAVAERINALAKADEAVGKKVVVLATEEALPLYSFGEVICVGRRADETSVAHNLYDSLRRCDEMGADVIYSECFEETGLSRAIMNRLRKAAGYRILEV